MVGNIHIYIYDSLRDPESMKLSHILQTFKMSKTLHNLFLGVKNLSQKERKYFQNLNRKKLSQFINKALKYRILITYFQNTL